MKQYRVLNIKGALLDKHQLEKYLENIASDHILQNQSEINTYPIPRMNENFEIITNVYNMLNEHIKLDIPIHPAGEWILDNFYVIEETTKLLEKEMTRKKYKNLLAVGNGAYKGFARIYILAAEIVAYTDGKIEPKNLVDYLRAYQAKKNLSMEEIWNLGLFLQIAIIENIRNICETIYSSQIQKYKVESIVERLIENKEKEELQFKNTEGYKTKVNKTINMRYPFIEYMSYKLRRYGKKAYPFLNILEEQVGKMGTDISEVIKKEHYDIATKKVSMGNCITSIKALQRINLIDIFESINKVDDILKEDPAGIYEKMDYKTKIDYRSIIEELSKKTKISEIYIARKALELARQKENKEESLKQKLKEENINESDIETELIKQKHIGYYLIGEGKETLLENLTGKRIKKLTNKQKMGLFISVKKIISITISFCLAVYLYRSLKNIFFSLILALLIYIPIEEMVIQIMQYILGKTVKPKRIPKLDYSHGIPKEEATFVVIPTIVDNKKKVKEMMQKLEVYYLANKSENLYFALLGDCSSSKNENEEKDKEVIEEGKKWVEKLNQKYPDHEFPKFHFLYRERIWNPKEDLFLGWERKRGMLNQFNKYLLQKQKNEFRVNTIEELSQKQIPQIKYIITLDADTELVLNTGLELIGAMAHILNKPVLNGEKSKVLQGYGIMQPHVGINLESARKTLFTKIYAGSGGTDSYTNAISDIYQDNFEEGIFTGKGIYDLKIFSTILKDQIPENTVLSHDLLEGSYLRCALASDITLMDGYPTTYSSFKTRLHRWTRGDWQIIRWLKPKIQNSKGKWQENPLNIISKYKILDNLIRSLFLPMILLSLIYIVVLDVIYKIKIWPIITFLLISLMMPSLLEIINKIIYKKNGETLQKTFDKSLSLLQGSTLRAILEIMSLPDKAYISINAIAKTIYRMTVSKKRLLEWTTAEEAERKAKNTLISYYQTMPANLVLSILTFILLFVYSKGIATIFLGFLSLLWILAPAIFYYIGKPILNAIPIYKITHQEKEYILEIAKKTWQFFKDHLNEKNNFLPPDNYQEDRNPKVIKTTSPTNIGLALLAVVSSYDLQLETLENTIKLLQKMLDTINKLAKWNGHLYNWYNIETLEPLSPKYISTVDSGNFIGYLYVLKEFLQQTLVETVEKGTENEEKDADKKEQLESMIKNIQTLIENTNFKHLYVEENKIFSIGFNIEENALTDSYYDLLASEARQASFIAIAKRDVPEKHWYALSRSLTLLNQYKGLISWSGTAFEYLMPNINMAAPEGSLLNESAKFAIMSQQQYSKKLNIPWGISEAAFSIKDLNNNYQYKAFGVPWLGIKRGLADEIVVSSYGTILAISETPKEVIQNLKRLETKGMFGQYGFYESIDYTPNRLKKDEKSIVVKTYMAHHQGLILLSINNFIREQILQKRFMANPEIKAIDILLQERMPENVIITKEKKEKIEKRKNVDYEAYCQREYNKMNEKINPMNVISSEGYTVVIDQKGKGYSKFKNIMINRYKETDEENQGIFFYFRNIKTKRIWTSHYQSDLPKPDKYTIIYAPDQNKFTRQDGNIETTTKITIMPNEPVEIREVELKNNGITEETIEVTSMLEPVLSEKSQDEAHKAFNNLFLSYEVIENTGTILVKRNKRNKEEPDVFLGVNLYTENDTIGEMEYEIDKEKFMGRGNMLLPKVIEKGLPLGRKTGLTTDPIIAIKKTLKVLPNETVKLYLMIAVSEEKQNAIKLIEENKNSKKIERNIELAKAKAEAENMYLGIKAKEIEEYQKMLGYLVGQNPLKNIMYKGKAPDKAETQELWKYGISGDLPILAVKIKDVNDISVVKEAIKAYEYLRIKNIQLDLVIINEEKKTYDNYVQEEIQNAILDKNLAYLQNQKGGIFLLNNLRQESKAIIEFRANLLINSSLGSIKSQLNDFEEEYLDKIRRVAKQAPKEEYDEQETIRESLSHKELKYNNEYGGFSNDGKEYIIRVNKDERLPTVWSNILANEKFGSVVTENMGGYTWYKNSRLNRLTAWNNNQVTDVPSESIFIKDIKNQKIWSLGLNPMPDNNDYYITYGFGYSQYRHVSNGILQKLDVYVPRKDPIKVQILHLENTQTQKKQLSLFYYIKPVLGEDERKSNGFLKLDYKEASNIITLKNTISENNTLLYISSSEKISSYTGSRKSFIGEGNLSNPEALREVELDRRDSIGEEAALVIELKVTLEALENKEIVFVVRSRRKFHQLSRQGL